MTFAVPLFLLATVAAGIPVLLHLIHRQKAREVAFSTLRFLKPSVQRTRRRRYLDDLAVLLARVAVLSLIAFGLARPALSSLGSLLGHGRSTAVAIVLDNSASMAVNDDGKPRFDTARKAAEQILALHSEGEPVGLFLPCGPPAPELGKLHPSHEATRQALGMARPFPERADLAARLAEARALLDRSDAANKEIYVISDDQAISWASLKSAEPDTKPGPPVVLVAVSRAPLLNVALQSVGLRSPAPASGVPVRASVEILNTGAVPQSRHLELFVDGSKEATSPTLTLPPGAPAKYEFRFTPERAGVHKGEVRLVEDDASPLDNRLSFALTVDQQVPVALIKSRRAEVAFAEDDFYLERALAPAGSGVGPLRLTSMTADEALNAPLADQAVVFCVNLPAPSAPLAEKLHHYIRDGGHVVWVCGPNVQAGAYNIMNSLALGELLPATLADPKDHGPGGAGGWTIGSLDAEHPSLAPLAEPASLYRSVLVYRHFPLTWAGSARGRELAKLDDGSPLLVDRNVGNGSVTLLATGLTLDWTNLPVKPLFLPLVARLSFHLAGIETERAPSIAGAPIVVPLPGSRNAGSEVEVVKPSGEVVRLRPPAGPSFRFDETHEPGVYLFRQGQGGSARQLACAVNIDPAESDPATEGTDQLRARLGPGPVIVCETPEQLPAAVRRLREGISLRDAFLAVVLVVLVLEVFLANRTTAPAAETERLTNPADTNAHSEAETVPTAGSAQEEAIHDFLAHI